jgi:hypothetical protein
MVSRQNRYYDFTVKGKRGDRDDVDFLMQTLVGDSTLTTAKLVDYALGLVNSQAGAARIGEYLFEGDPIQRNYAALFLKRRGQLDRLQQAVDQGLVDLDQAFSK